jgi:hypothetical protein
MFCKLTRRTSSAADRAWYDAEENAHRRVTMTLPDGSTGIMGRDVFATYVLMQVDDGKVVSNCEADVKALREALVVYETKWHAPCVGFLGGEEAWIGEDAKKITATKQIDKFVERYSQYLNLDKKPDVPMAPDAKYEPMPSMNASSAIERKAVAALPYREMVGSLTYNARLCHPAIAFGTNGTAQFVSNPGMAHWKLLKHLGEFAATQRDAGITFRAPEAGTRQLSLVFDANWAGDKTSRRSVDNYVIFLYGNLIDYGPRKQKFSAMSTFESELGACARGGTSLKAAGAVILGMGIQLELPVPTYGDNESVLKNLTNATHGSSAKHIDIRMFWMKDEIEHGLFEMMHVLSAGNMADVMTKALPCKPFWRLMNDITGDDITDVGRRIRRGDYAYQAAATALRLKDRPEITLHSSFPGPKMDEYHGKLSQGAPQSEFVGLGYDF